MSILSAKMMDLFRLRTPPGHSRRHPLRQAGGLLRHVGVDPSHDSFEHGLFSFVDPSHGELNGIHGILAPF